MPKIDIAALPVEESTGYPAPYDAIVKGVSGKSWAMQAGLISSA